MEQVVQAHISSMMREVMAMVAAATGDALGKALQDGSAQMVVSGALPAKVRRPSRVTKPAAPARSAEALERLSDALYEQICADPGEPMVVYGGKLSMTCAQLATPIKRLKKAGRVRSAGQRQDTRYFPMAHEAATSS